MAAFCMANITKETMPTMARMIQGGFLNRFPRSSPTEPSSDFDGCTRSLEVLKVIKKKTRLRKANKIAVDCHPRAWSAPPKNFTSVRTRPLTTNMPQKAQINR